MYGLSTTISRDNDIGSVGYRNNNTTGIAIGDQPESIYMTGIGTFFEGCMISGVSSDAVDDAVQANIIAAGYGQ